MEKRSAGRRPGRLITLAAVAALLCGCVGASRRGADAGRAPGAEYRNDTFGIRLAIPPGAEVDSQPQAEQTMKEGADLVLGGQAGSEVQKDAEMLFAMTSTATQSQVDDTMFVGISLNRSTESARDEGEVAETLLQFMEQNTQPGAKFERGASTAAMCLAGAEFVAADYSIGFPKDKLRLRGTAFFSLRKGRVLTVGATYLTEAGRRRAIEWLDSGRLAPAPSCASPWEKARRLLERKDYALALPALRLAAAGGEARAQYELGGLYDEGRGVRADAKESARWYALAAARGDAAAQVALGLCYYDGRGVLRDDERYFLWMRKAAQQEHPFGQLAVGMAYDTGHGVPRDSREALRWFRLSAEQGYAPAQGVLGERYLEGREGEPPDYDQARSWLEKAARGGDPRSMMGMAYIYQKGMGVKQDFVEAYQWLLRADVAGEERAKDKLAGLDAVMTPAEKESARAKAKSPFPNER